MAVGLKVGIGAETTELKAGLKDAETQIKKFLDNVVTIGKVGEKLQSIGKSLSVGLTLPIVGLSTVAIKAFADLEGVRTAFVRLNDPKLLDNLRKATKGTTSDLELMQAAVKSEKFGLSTNALPTLLEYAGRVAKDTGQEVSYLVDSITTGIGRKSPLILDNLGISASQLKAELGGVSMEAASVATVTEAVGRIAAKELAKMGKDTKTLTESWLQVKTAITNSMGKIGEIISKNLDISSIIDKLTGYINSAVIAFENLSPGIQQAILVVVGLVAAAGPLLAVIGSILAILPSVVAGFGLFSVALTAMTGPIGLVVLGIGAIIAAVVGNWDKIKPYIISTINYFRELYNESIVVRVGVTSLVVYFKNAFSVIANVLKTAYEIFKSFAKATADLFSGVGSIVKGVLTGDFTEVKNGVSKVGVAILSGIDNVKSDSIKGFNDLFTDIKTNLNNGIKTIQNNETLKPITDIKIFDSKKIANKVNETVTEGIKKGVKKAGETPVIIDLVAIDMTALKAGFDRNIEWTTSYLQTMRDLYYNAAEGINSAVPTLTTALSNAQIAITEMNLELSEAFSDIFSGGVSDLISNGAEAIGDAMANGGNFIEALGQSVLSTIGGIAVQLGKAAIGIGVGMIAIKAAFKNPLTAIAAGVALVAIGSFINGKVANMTSGGGNTSSGSISSGGGGGSQSYSSSYSSGGSGGSEFVFRISGNDLVTVTDRARDKNLRIGG